MGGIINIEYLLYRHLKYLILKLNNRTNLSVHVRVGKKWFKISVFMISNNEDNANSSRTIFFTHPVISVSVGLANPKSRIFNSQSSLTAMLEGFKSLQNTKESQKVLIHRNIW